MDNPFQSPAESSEIAKPSVEELRGAAGVQSKHIRLLGIFLCIVGGIAAVPSGMIFLISLAALSSRASEWKVAAIAGPVFLSLVSMVAIGYGLFNTRRWAWTSAVAIALPMVALSTAAFLLMAVWEGKVYSVFTAAALGTLVFMAWTLLSNSGRNRYQLMVESAARQKDKRQAYRTGVIDDVFDRRPASEVETEKHDLRGWLDELRS